MPTMVHFNNFFERFFFQTHNTTCCGCFLFFGICQFTNSVEPCKSAGSWCHFSSRWPCCRKWCRWECWPCRREWLCDCVCGCRCQCWRWAIFQLIVFRAMFKMKTIEFTCFYCFRKEISKIWCVITFRNVPDNPINSFISAINNRIALFLFFFHDECIDESVSQRAVRE